VTTGTKTSIDLGEESMTESETGEGGNVAVQRSL
jgi:hypothetical protein